MLTFAVDPVEAVTTPLPSARFDPEAVLGARVLARSPDLDAVVAPPDLGLFGVNGFALAVHLAFAQHRPLALSPDAVWLAIVQGFALHVSEHEAALRERLVRHQGQRTIGLGDGSLGDVDWPTVADHFVQALAAEVNPGLLRALTAPFSTTGPTEHTAHCVAAMDAFSRFFDYELLCICGIPSVTLLGTPEDWRAVRERFRVLAELGLQWWAERLDPVLEQLVRSAEGHPDPEFWQCLYKPRKAYAQERATGWLVRLFPYLEETGGVLSRSSMRSEGGTWVHEPVAPSSFPRGLSKAAVRVAWPGQDSPVLRTLCAGFFGVRQEPGGALAAHLGWALLEEPTAALWESLARAHRLPPPRPDRRLETATAVPALLLEFYQRFDGGPLYGGVLTLTPAPAGTDWRGSELVADLAPPSPEGGLSLRRLALRLGRLRDGRELLWFRADRGQPEQVFLRAPGAPPPYQLVATSLLELYQRLAAVTSFPPWEVKGSWSPPDQGG